MKLRLTVEGVGGGAVATRIAALQARILAAVAARPQPPQATHSGNGKGS